MSKMKFMSLFQKGKKVVGCTFTCLQKKKSYKNQTCDVKTRYQKLIRPFEHVSHLSGKACETTFTPSLIH